MLLAGKPVLVIPTVAEQYMLGQRVEGLGAGRLARPDDVNGVIGGLLGILRCSKYHTVAREFRERYASRNSRQIAESIVESIERLVR